MQRERGFRRSECGAKPLLAACCYFGYALDLEGAQAIVGAFDVDGR